MEAENLKKTEEVMHKILVGIMQSKKDGIRESKLKDVCKQSGVHYDLIFNMLTPYLKSVSDLEIKGMENVYFLNTEGIKYATTLLSTTILFEREE